MSREEVVDPSTITLEEGTYLVKLAREAIETFVTSRKRIDIPEDIPSKFLKPGLAFVTIEKIVGETKTLRGCIGFLKPVASLAQVVIDAAIAAATEDPRFPPLSPKELDSIVIEVSVLSLPKTISDPLTDIEIGRHGIIISRGLYSGTLLPQVPVEYCWDVETFLGEACLKAGLRPDCWLDPNTVIQVYEAIVFYEKSPRGEIAIRSLKEEYEKRCGWLKTFTDLQREVHSSIRS